MGIQKKHGKGRLDKWYKLAKEKGYRARAAFKLIQLNRKFRFLENSKVLVDLCAAPGSWCQVAAETMPANSLIIGVDLAPIRPIPRTITFQSDITTDTCRTILRAHLKTWKAETVLHDGAPNVGTAWVQDAFSQAELVLQALKLATELLDEGGTFVTKVFRSKDYNPLLWVFNQLFHKVEATKPPSSRNVSAEIFVVCRGFKAPKRLDPKLLDPRSVFAELANPATDNEAKVFNPEKKKRKRGGYEANEYTQFKEAPASTYILATDPISILASFNKLTFQQGSNLDMLLEALDQSPSTTLEIRHCCQDLKVLGRKEFRTLLRWRLQLREKFGFASDSHPPKITDEGTAIEIMSLDDELKNQRELQSLSEAHDARKKREKRRENARKQRETFRMQMHMLAPTDIGLEQTGPNGEDQLFAPLALSHLREGQLFHGWSLPIAIPPGSIESSHVNFFSSNEIQQYQSGDDDHEGSDSGWLDGELNLMYAQYKARRANSDVRNRAKKAREEHDDEWEGLSDTKAVKNEHGDYEFEPSSFNIPQGLRTFNVDGLPTSAVLSKRAALFFGQGDLKDVVGDISEISQSHGATRSGRATATSVVNDHYNKIQRGAICKLKLPDGKIHQRQNGDLPEVVHVSATGLREYDTSNGTRKPTIALNSQGKRPRGRDERTPNSTEDRPNVEIITAEAMTLAHAITSGQRPTSDIVDEGFNKYAFKDRDGLPDWFLDDEGQHSKPHRPITAAAASAIKAKLRALNARPIKKVREAKDRKRFKMAQKLEKLRKKSSLLADEEGLTEKDKAKTIAKIMNKGARKRPKRQVKVVVARGSNRGISGRPRGIKGKYKLVDARLKKDVRADKRTSK